MGKLYNATEGRFYNERDSSQTSVSGELVHEQERLMIIPFMVNPSVPDHIWMVPDHIWMSGLQLKTLADD